MISFLKKYWDILSGLLTGIVLAAISKYEVYRVQLYYSVIILILVSIGFFRVVKQEAEKRGKKKERKHNIVDSLVDVQKSIKAINLAQAPTSEGEKIGEITINFLGVIKKTMEKFKTFFSKFKGYLLTTALAILTIIEMCGGYINTLCGGVFAINGVAILPVITLACTAVVGVISNGYTKEQREKIKTLFSKSITNELVIEEIKKTIKEKAAQLAQYNKVLATQESELATLNKELATVTNTFDAKKAMFGMKPQLATEAEVQAAANALIECNGKIEKKNEEIAKTKVVIDTITTTINALKSQL